MCCDNRTAYHYDSDNDSGIDWMGGDTVILVVIVLVLSSLRVVLMGGV